MASNINVVLNGATLQVINTTDSSTRVNSAVGGPTLPASESTYIDFLPIAAAGTVLTLPAATIWFLYIKSLAGVNGSPGGNITVRKQVAGGALTAAADSEILLPLGVYLYGQQTETAGGIVAVTLVASVNLTPVEILMAA